jgi:hypothetical protein
MSAGSGTQEAGEASAGPARAGGIPGAGRLVRLPQDHLAVEWWLARRAVDGEGVPYAADGVLALWPQRREDTDRWTFGLEVEFAVADAGWVAAELHALGLSAAPTPLAYHAERDDGRWAVEQDRTVSTVFENPGGGPPVVVGGEVVSPPLRDTPEAWRQVAAVLAVLARCGAAVNRSCGLHVHVGTDALRGAPGQPAADRDLLPFLSRLAMLASVCFEDLVFRLASAEGGNHRGQAFFYRHCRPLERPLISAYESLADLTGALTGSLAAEGAARRAALNLTNVGDPHKDTIEFRQCNGTLDGRVVQGFVRLCAALIGGARWAPAAAHLPPSPLGGHWARRLGAGAEAAASLDADPRPLWDFLAAVCPDGLPLEAAGSEARAARLGCQAPRR